MKLLPYLPSILITLLTIRIVALGSSIGDAIAILALAGLQGYKMFIDQQVTVDPSAEMKAEVDKLKGMISEVSVAVSQRPQNKPIQFKF